MILDWTRATVLTLTEFEVVWELLQLGETPWQLDPPRRGHTREERRRIVADALQALQRRGLGDDRGPHPQLAERLRLLARPESVLDVRFRDRSLTAAVAARSGHRCTLAVRHQDEIAVLDVPGHAAAEALVELLGPVVPGDGAPTVVPADVLDAASAAAADEPGRLGVELHRRGVTDANARLVAHMCDGTDRLGQFGASRRSGDGRTRRATYVIGLHRTPSGHYAHLRRRRPDDGRDLITIEPLSHRGLLQHLDELAAAVPG
jgi:hypothetical protein